MWGSRNKGLIIYHSLYGLGSLLKMARKYKCLNSYFTNTWATKSILFVGESFRESQAIFVSPVARDIWLIGISVLYDIQEGIREVSRLKQKKLDYMCIVG